MIAPVTLLPEGFRDRLPPEADALARLEGAVMRTAAANGYARVAPPLAEYEEGLVGRLKGLAAQDLLRVVDPLSQRTLALRPDITAQVGRIASTRLAHRARPLRLCYGGPAVRVRGTELDPTREAMQVGAEIVGTDHVDAVAEALRVALDALERAGVAGLSVDLTLPDLVGLLAAGPLPVADVEAVRRELDGKDAAALVASGGAAYLPLIAAAGPVDQALERLAALPGHERLESRVAAVKALAAGLEGRATVTLDPTERHGFAFQSWIAFSVFADGVRGEIGRGGAYAIVHRDGREEPAVGFSLYLDRLVEGVGPATEERVFLPAGTPARVGAALRREGRVTIAALGPGDDPAALGCTQIWNGAAAVPLER